MRTRCASMSASIRARSASASAFGAHPGQEDAISAGAERPCLHGPILRLEPLALGTHLVTQRCQLALAPRLQLLARAFRLRRQLRPLTLRRRLQLRLVLFSLGGERAHIGGELRLTGLELCLYLLCLHE
eukprot:4878449-Prymnesium_polylepis.2